MVVPDERASGQQHGVLELFDDFESPGSFTATRRIDNLSADYLGIIGVFLQKGLQFAGYHLFYWSTNFRRNQFVFRL